MATPREGSLALLDVHGESLPVHALLTGDRQGRGPPVRRLATPVRSPRTRGTREAFHVKLNKRPAALVATAVAAAMMLSACGGGDDDWFRRR